METRVSLYVTIDNETCKATVRANVSMWDGAILKQNTVGYEHQTMERPAELDHSVYPYMVAVLRNASDTFVAHMLDKIAAGEILMLHEVKSNPEE